MFMCIYIYMYEHMYNIYIYIHIIVHVFIFAPFVCPASQTNPFCFAKRALRHSAVFFLHKDMQEMPGVAASWGNPKPARSVAPSGLFMVFGCGCWWR